MIYLIGGAPRVGKTQAVIEVLKQRPMNAIASEEVRYMLTRTLPNTRLKRALKQTLHDIDPTRHTVAELWQDQVEQARALWPSLTHIMEAYQQDGQDVLLEGVAVLPELIAQLPFRTKALILSNQSLTHAAAVLRRARANRHDWLHAKPEAAIANYCQYFAYMDQYFRLEAEKYGLPVMTVTDQGLTNDLKRAATQLLHT